MSPLVGMSPITTAAFRIAGTVSSEVVPNANKSAKRDDARRAIRVPEIRSAANAPSTKSAPIKPNSSATSERMKSVWASGR